MDKNGHIGIPEVPFRPSARALPGMEVLSLSSLPERARGHGIDAYSPSRLAFHELITVRSGSMRCSLDFTDHLLAEGCWLWVRPGQVHQYRSDLTAADGTLVLFRSGFLGAAAAEAALIDRYPRQQPLAPDGNTRDTLRGVLELLTGEYRRLGDPPLEMRVEVIRHLLAVLVLHLAHLPGTLGSQEAGSEAFRRFQQAVERDFTHTHRVEDYARRLGYSVRTLTRAVRAASGCGAKRFIDDRVLLEAERLLAHTDLPVTAIGERIGFPDPTVFTKFFRRRAGETPVAFRTRAVGRRS
jgi:AraC-like DNA-binding protein